jgi:hypothetical protein
MVDESSVGYVCPKAARREERVAAAHALLAKAVGELQTSEGWKSMLESLARAGRFSLRRLSFRNQLLARAQKPHATDVGTFEAWVRAGRVVRRGEKALCILAPLVCRVPKKDAPDETESKLVGFRPHLVFDASQTDALPGERGRPLPEPVKVTEDITAPEVFANSVERLRSVALGLGPDVVAKIEIRPRRAEDHPCAEGWYVRTSKTIVVVSEEKSPSQEFATLLHELGHAILHGNGEHHARAEQEVEAESTAYVCASALGLDTSGFSFAYVAGWAARDDAARLVMATGQRVVRAVNVILDALQGTTTTEINDVQDSETRRAA